jgi:hypothetical protein
MTTQVAAGRTSVIRDHVSIASALLGGAVGTTLMTAMMFFVAPTMLGHPMDVPKMLGDMIGAGWTVGLVAHVMNGVVIFPLAYALLVSRMLPGSPIVKGLSWGVLLWFAAETTVMPMAGAGFFSSAAGGMKAAIASLVGHLLYGGSFGAVVGAAGDAR